MAGDYATALRELKDVESQLLAKSVSVEPFFAELHGDPEFERLLARLGLQRGTR